MAIAFGPFTLDADRRELRRDGAVVSITPKAFDLLVALVERSGAVVTKDELMATLWPDTTVEESNLTFQISTLRKVLGNDGAKFIATLPGRGYQFVAPVERPIEKRVEANRGRPLWAAALAIVVLGATIATIYVRREPAMPPSSDIRSLAVLPFKPIVAAQRDEALELGIADTLITRLSHMPNVVVRPIAAVRQYSKLDDDPLAAARALDVDAVLDGSIQRNGSRVRVTVRLLRTSDGRPLWATQLDDTRRELFAAQDYVADNVARAVAPALTPDVHAQLTRKLTGDPAAYEEYMKGRYWSFYDPVRAEPFYNSAIARDPLFAAAYAGLAESYLQWGRFGNTSPKEVFEKARVAAMKAMELDPNLGEAHAALAQVYADHDWNWDRADAEYRRALELQPSSDWAHGQYAYVLAVRGDLGRALEHLDRAIEIDPVTPIWLLQKGFVLGCAGHFAEAVALLEDGHRRHPGHVALFLHLGMAYTNAGRYDDAIRTYEQGLARSRSTQLLALKAWALARAGRTDEARKVIADVERIARPGAAPSHNLALAWAALGDFDRAFAELERAYRDRLFLLRVITIHPGYAPLRSDPRYADLVRRMGLG